MHSGLTMTRINTISPEYLIDKHLMAEYRELPRIFTAVRKLQEQGKGPEDVDIPEKYCLGQGHNKFFYSKLEWLHKRYEDIFCELLARSFHIDDDLYRRIFDGMREFAGTEWYKNWEPSPEDHYLNMQRITKRHFNEPI